jgi:tripartite-type tricarboxylate transporter receptor subunit TctC
MTLNTRLVVTFLAALATTVAQAQTFPTHALKMIVGASPGGGSDGLARPLAAQLALDLKHHRFEGSRDVSCRWLHHGLHH